MAEMCRYSVCFLTIACAIISSKRISAQSESGDSCTKEGSPGICKLLSDCSSALADIKKGIYPQICGFQGSKSVVCCVELGTIQSSTVGEKSLKKCKEYSRHAFLKEVSPTLSVITKYIYTLVCNIDYAKLIVGGDKARKSEFPHMIVWSKAQVRSKNKFQTISIAMMTGRCWLCGKSDTTLRDVASASYFDIWLQNRVPGNILPTKRSIGKFIEALIQNKMDIIHAQLGYMVDGEIIYACGGSLISENYVLTASHCFNNRKRGQPQVVRVGITKQSDTSLVQIRNVVELLKHPNYRDKYNDIGLLRVDKNFDFNPTVRPACLYTKKDVPVENAIASGWGDTSYNGRGSNDLMKVILKLASADECSTHYDDLSKGIDDNLMVCAGNDHKDTCQGDSGGPLQIYHENTKEIKCMFDVIGVTSFGKPCGIGNAPGVYTRVSNYLNWIENIVWKD